MTSHYNVYLTVSLGLWPLEPPDSVIHGDLLQEGVALGLREVRSLHLAKVELHSTIVADDMGEKGLAIQRVLGYLESDSRLATILGEGHHHLLPLKVLSKESKVQKLLVIKASLHVSLTHFNSALTSAWFYIHCQIDKIQVALMSYNKAADDIILLVGFSKVLRHTVGGLLAFPRVCIRMFLLT